MLALQRTMYYSKTDNMTKAEQGRGRSLESRLGVDVPGGGLSCSASGPRRNLHGSHAYDITPYNKYNKVHTGNTGSGRFIF